MYGRYGNDKLNNFLMIAALVLLFASVIVSFIPVNTATLVVSAVLSILILSAYAYTMFRMMSKNIYKRRQENMTFLKASRAVKRFLTFNTSYGTKSNNRDDADHIFRDCTKCGTTLRLPRRSGKHSVKCPKCTHSFYVKSK